jgi:hypothetical protein
MWAQTEEAVVKVKMVLGVRSGTNVIMNRLCTIVTLVVNKSCTFSHLVTNHAIVNVATSKLHVLIYSNFKEREHGVFENIWFICTWSF